MISLERCPESASAGR